MTHDRHIPDDPLGFIRRCVGDRKIRWTYHVNMRLKGRFITREEILASVEQYEMIEEYPEDKYLPSYLVYSQHQGRALHVLFAAENNVRVVTAYRPNPSEWEADLKMRRQSS